MAKKPAAKKPAPGYTLPKLPTVDELVNTQLQPQIDYVNQQQSMYDQQAEARNKAMQGLTQALIETLRPNVAQVGQLYDTAAGQTAALASRSADLLGQANTNPVVQTDLQAIGAPDSQKQQVAQVLGQVFNGGAASLFGAQGQIPGDRLVSDKLAAQNKALGDLTVAGLHGQDYLAKALLGDQAQHQKFRSQLDQILSSRPGLVSKATLDLANAQLDQQKFVDARKKEAFNEFVQTTRLKQSGKRITDAEAKQKFDQWAKEQGLTIRWNQLDQADQRLAIDRANANKLQHVNVGGKAYTFDPVTGSYYIPGTTTPVNPKAAPKITSGQIIAARKYVAGAKANGGYWYSAVDQTKPLTATELSSLLKGANENMGDLLGPNGQQIAEKLGIGWHDQTPQDTYVTLAKTYGIPAQRAFNMVAAQFPGWGTAKRRASYFPKAGAAADGGIQGATAKDAAAVRLVQSYLGTPYVWGGSKPGGFDCSGLLQYTWAQNGVQIPRTTYDQWKVGVAVDKAQLRPGDAVFFRGSDSKNGLPGHVGMYIGGGRFVEAPRTGTTVRISNLAGRSDYMGARRYA